MPAGRRLHRLTVWVRPRAIGLTACGQAQGHDPLRRGTCPDQPFARHAPSSMRRPPTSRYRRSGGRRSPRPTITSLAAGTRPPRSERPTGRNRAAGWRRTRRDLSCADDLRCRRSSERFRLRWRVAESQLPRHPGEIVAGAAARRAWGPQREDRGAAVLHGATVETHRSHIQQKCAWARAQVACATGTISFCASSTSRVEYPTRWRTTPRSRACGRAESRMARLERAPAPSP
jgi:hypothetical protein